MWCYTCSCRCVPIRVVLGTQATSNPTQLTLCFWQRVQHVNSSEPPQDVIITARRWRGQCVYTLRDRCTWRHLCLVLSCHFSPWSSSPKAACVVLHQNSWSSSEQQDPSLDVLQDGGSVWFCVPHYWCGWRGKDFQYCWDTNIFSNQNVPSVVYYVFYYVFLFCAQSPFPEKRWDTILAGLQARAVNGSLYTVECGKVKLFKIYTVYWTIYLLENVLVCTIILYFRFCKLIQFNELLYTWWYWNCDFKPKVCT